MHMGVAALLGGLLLIILLLGVVTALQNRFAPRSGRRRTFRDESDDAPNEGEAAHRRKRDTAQKRHEHTRPHHHANHAERRHHADTQRERDDEFVQRQKHRS